ncbi:31579_t:CDS:2 [Gigaspora margarita]|uniref:31579_t:CDS:1 n=1 Tax=Gigaspora margarita TaxID=4874 RepID=A0ABN7VHM3_GIGMA|nr:31579_t:CDS:2 [Gigaspora margarita]
MSTSAYEIEKTPVDDPDFFTLEHEWSLLNFLLFRQHCVDFRVDKTVEHSRYVCSLANIISWEQASSELIEQVKDALSRVQGSNIFGWGCDLSTTNIPDCDWGCMSCDSGGSYRVQLPNIPEAWTGLKGQ